VQTCGDLIVVCGWVSSRLEGGVKIGLCGRRWFSENNLFEALGCLKTQKQKTKRNRKKKIKECDSMGEKKCSKYKLLKLVQ